MKKTLLILIAGIILSIAATSCKKSCVCTVIEGSNKVGRMDMGLMKDEECTTRNLERNFSLPVEHYLECRSEKWSQRDDM